MSNSPVNPSAGSTAPIAPVVISPVVVLDASAAIAFTLPDEPLYAQAQALIADLDAQGARLIAPPLFEAETDSVLRLRVAVKGTLTAAGEVLAQGVLDALPVQIIYDPATRGRARQLAAQLGRPRVYDATYAALADLHGIADRHGTRLWTADERFFNAVTSAGLVLVKFIGSYPVPGPSLAPPTAP